MDDLSREEKLAFFINLYNMMAIHALVTCGVPAGPLDRRKFFGDFKYVIGGRAYSLSAIQNGILRGNQRPPYNIAKPFGQKDQRSKVNKSDPSEMAKRISMFTTACFFLKCPIDALNPLFLCVYLWHTIVLPRNSYVYPCHPNRCSVLFKTGCMFDLQFLLAREA